MKKKSVITILSVVLNLVLFSALIYLNKINSRSEGTTAPMIRLQELPQFGLVQSDGREITLASIEK